MKQLFFSLFFATSCFCSVITDPIIQVFQYFEIPHDGTEKNLAALAKKHFGRKHGQERWEMKPIQVKDEKHLFDLFDQIGLVQEVVPKHKHYDYVLILGARESAVKARLDFLEKLERNGLTYGKAVLLGSTRKLDRSVEKIDVQTESELLEKMYHKKRPYILISAPNRKDGTRANTADTLRCLLKKKIKPQARMLAISSQPYILYQNQVLQHFFQTFQLETVGPSTESQKMELYLEALCSYLNPVFD